MVNESAANPYFTLATGGWVGPFAVNAPGTELQEIGLDIIFPKGLTDNGVDYTVTTEHQARPIDGDGEPTGGWTTLGTISVTRSSLQPVRLVPLRPARGGRSVGSARSPNHAIPL